MTVIMTVSIAAAVVPAASFGRTAPMVMAAFMLLVVPMFVASFHGSSRNFLR
jgi:hypothetical protein